MKKEKKLVQGQGINDYGGKVSKDGKDLPFYIAWQSMLSRCYSSKSHDSRPTYIGCSVCPEWLSLSNFKKWHDDNYITGYQLDKDILDHYNKEYGPDKCVYVPRHVNILFVDCGKSRGDLPIGVCVDKGKYKANISLYGKRVHLGLFDTPEGAHQAYCVRKQAHVAEVACTELHERTINQAIHDAMIVKASIMYPVV